MKLMNKVLSWVAGILATLLLIHGSLLQIANTSAKMYPDGLPLDPNWQINTCFVVGLVLVVIAYILSPEEDKFEHLF